MRSPSLSQAKQSSIDALTKDDSLRFVADLAVEDERVGDQMNEAAPGVDDNGDPKGKAATGKKRKKRV